MERPCDYAFKYLADKISCHLGNRLSTQLKGQQGDVTEKLYHGSTKEHGYALTLPGTNRIGINLKWLLASCFIIPGKVDTPAMLGYENNAETRHTQR